MLADWAGRGQIALGSAYLAFGSLQAFPGQNDGLAEPLMLVAGGILVLVGDSGAFRSPIPACVLVWVGGLLGFAPSIGTVLLPLLALFVLDATLLDTGSKLEARKAHGSASS